MQTSIPHIYKTSSGGNGLLYSWFSSMHTRVDILLNSCKSEKELLSVIESIYEALGQLEKIANYYDPSSELANVNRIASAFPVQISRELYLLIALCLDYHRSTMGCFDVTVHSEPYHQDTIHSIELSPDEQTVFFHQKGVTINLSGFLKGYALEKIREILVANELADALVNMGNSSVLALGNHPAGEGWKVDFGRHAGTENEPTGQNDKEQVVHLQNECLTTSGNNSVSRKHIISPQSGKLVEGLRQLAVVTDDGITGEVLSTGLFVAREQQREAIIAEFQPRLVLEF